MGKIAKFSKKQATEKTVRQTHCFSIRYFRTQLYYSSLKTIKTPLLCFMLMNKFERFHINFVDVKVVYWPDSKGTFIQ